MIDKIINQLVDTTAINFADYLGLYYDKVGCAFHQWRNKETGRMYTTKYALKQYRIFTNQTLKK